MALKLLWLKPDKHYVTWKGSSLTSTESSITGLYNVRYSPLYIINSWKYRYLNMIQVTILQKHLVCYLVAMNVASI